MVYVAIKETRFL